MDVTFESVDWIVHSVESTDYKEYWSVSHTWIQDRYIQKCWGFFFFANSTNFHYADTLSETRLDSDKTFTHVQDWTQKLFNKNFIFARAIWHFHIISYLTELCVFWWLFTHEDTLWCLSWTWISLAFNPGHIWRHFTFQYFMFLSVFCRFVWAPIHGSC